MKITRYEENDEWLAARRGKITGTRLKDLIVKRGTGKKIGYYELIAEKLALAPDGENPMDRGHRLEEEASARFEKETGIKMITDLVIWTRDDNDNIALSPDGYTEDLKSAAEIKCLSSARYLEALLTGEIPKEYEEQIIQYFIVNEDLETLYFLFYEPRIAAKDFFYFTIKRSEKQTFIDEYLELERRTLEEIDEIVLKLSNF